MKVTLIAKTQIEFEFINKISDHYHKAKRLTSPTDSLVEYSARKCYNSTDKMFERDNFVQSVLKSGHLSVAEHVHFVFEVEDISVACLGQLVRHGLMSHSVQSTRFVDQSDVEFVIPESIANHDFAEAYIKHCDSSLALYKLMRDFGVTKGDARYCLPTGMETSLIVSGNASMWRNFISQRCDKAAQTEIRMLANEILRQLYKQSPNIFEDLYKKFIEYEEVND